MITAKKTKPALQEQFYPAKRRIVLTTGEILRIIREKNHLSQNELAKESGLTQATLSSLENGRIQLGVSRAKILAEILHVHPAVLVFPDIELGKIAA